ncbi:MAG TPA: FtsX-like permease family protein, partial [Lacunisphaera sp.]|nr:FtsX-like permease family protein [Lacunisphaera sp.]
GKSIRVNGRAGTIVGIMPPKFQFPANEDLWIPVNAEFPVRPRNDRGVNFISVIARLKPGVSAQQAEADLSAIAKGFAEQFPDTNKQFTKGYVRPLIAAFTGGNLNGLLYTMLGLCVGVLLIACINVMNMQFARAALRSKELAVRSSLGATRIRLVRQMLTESLLIAALGATLGIGIAFWTTDYLNLYVHSGDQNTRIPSWMTFDLDVMVLSVVVGAAIFSALVSGFVPAWMSSRASAIDALKEGGRGNTSRAVNAITRGLVVFQILITCALLVSSVVMVRSIIKQQTLDYGYDTQGILGARMGLMEGDYPDSARRQLFYERLLRELRASPQFEAVALTYRFRMVFSGNGPIEIEGKSYKQDSDRTTSEFENVTAGYHEVLGQKVIEGRYLADEDSDQKLPVAVVNASFAKKHFNGQALGRRFRTINQNGTQPGPWRQVIGVVTDVRMAGPFNNNTDGTGFYVPLFSTAFGPAADTPQAQQFGTAVIRPRGGQRPEALAAALQAIVSKVDPNLPLYFVGTPKVAMDSFLAQLRLTAVMFTTFGVIAIVLASVGLYGVMSFSVNQRNQEFGVRMALGADAARILRMVLGQGAWQLGLGLGLGVLATAGVAWGFSGPLTNFLFQTNPLDPLPYLGVIALVSLVSLAAILIPARRATRVDPMVALRAQ